MTSTVASFRVLWTAVIALAGLCEPIFAQICGIDDRLPSSNPAVARLRVDGHIDPCTAFLLANGKMVTAEHCFDDPGEYIVEFNVPLSGPGGELMPSEPEHRFEVDEGSIVHGSGIVGDDWAVFEVFETLGKTPLEKYGKYLTVAQMDLAEGAMIRITGYGRASGTLNKTQQSSADTYEGISGTTISFFTDVYQGVSGAPVIDDATGFVVGVEHTSGCPNLGTSTYNEDFWTAMGISAVTLDQRSEDDQRLLGTNIGRWQNTEFADIPIMETPSIINSTSGATEWLRGFQEIEDNEKYNRWNASSAVVNHHEFAMPSAPGLFVSWFKATHGGVTIKTDLLDAPGTTGGTIRFKDPWLIDSLDEELGNNPLNRGSAALFKTRPSPFYPNLSTPYNGDVYKGTFLFQSVGVGLPYYSVEAPEVNYLGAQNIESYFKMWSASNQDAIIPDASENITGVEFRSENATIRALYKGHLHSSSVDAVARNSTRRLVRDVDGRYHVVYESAGSIWYTRSTNGGQTWSPETIGF